MKKIKNILVCIKNNKGKIYGHCAGIYLSAFLLSEYVKKQYYNSMYFIFSTSVDWYNNDVC